MVLAPSLTGIFLFATSRFSSPEIISLASHAMAEEFHFRCDPDQILRLYNSLRLDVLSLRLQALILPFMSLHTPFSIFKFFLVSGLVSCDSFLFPLSPKPHTSLYRVSSSSSRSANLSFTVSFLSPRLQVNPSSSARYRDTEGQIFHTFSHWHPRPIPLPFPFV